METPSMDGRTVREFIQQNRTQQAKDRLARLVDLGAPKVSIDRQQQFVDQENKTADVGKIAQFADEVIYSFEPKKYRRGTGIEFTLTDGSKLWLIPGPYGFFLTDHSR